MTVVDTSFLIAAFDGDDARHASSRTTLRGSARLLVPTEILVETLGVVKAKRGRPASALVLDALYAMPNLRWVQTCDLPHAYRLCKEEPSLSLPDAIAVSQALRSGLQLLTHDAHQAEALERRRRAAA